MYIKKVKANFAFSSSSCTLLYVCNENIHMPEMLKVEGNKKGMKSELSYLFRSGHRECFIKEHF